MTDQTDEEIEATPTRPQLLQSAILRRDRRLGSLTVRPLTAETLSYLFECENFFIKGLKGERVAANNANAIWSTAEFIYIHAGDPEEVAQSIWLKYEFRKNVRQMLAGALNDSQILTQALPLIEQMVTEYFAAQNEISPANKLKKPTGKESARHGKQATSR